MYETGSQPQWLAELLNVPNLTEGAKFQSNKVEMTVIGGIPRSNSNISDAQKQTRDSFGFKWDQRDTFEHSVSKFAKSWMIEKYGLVETWLEGLGDSPIVVDAGCGAGMSGLLYFESVLQKIRYLGVDVSKAVDVASDRFFEKGLPASFIQADIQALPLMNETVDMVFSEGVLHHTDNTRTALSSVVRILRPGGRILFYVYARKGPVREFTDDLIRDKMQELSPEAGWREMENLTALGKILGDLNIEIDIKEPITLLDIPAGRISIQRLFYWYFCKSYYRPEMTLDEMNHINFDWFAPKNAIRQSPEQVRDWCDQLGLKVERFIVETAGITVVARKEG